MDVRTSQEFKGGNVIGSINIPLQEMPYRIDELKEFQAPIIVCCASGARSSQAQYYVSKEGIECVNGGSWLNVNFIKTQTI